MDEGVPVLVSNLSSHYLTHAESGVDGVVGRHVCDDV